MDKELIEHVKEYLDNHQNVDLNKLKPFFSNRFIILDKKKIMDTYDNLKQLYKHYLLNNLPNLRLNILREMNVYENIFGESMFNKNESTTEELTHEDRTDKEDC